MVKVHANERRDAKTGTCINHLAHQIGANTSALGFRSQVETDFGRFIVRRSASVEPVGVDATDDLPGFLCHPDGPTAGIQLIEPLTTTLTVIGLVSAVARPPGIERLQISTMLGRSASTASLVVIMG